MKACAKCSRERKAEMFNVGWIFLGLEYLIILLLDAGLWTVNAWDEHPFLGPLCPSWLEQILSIEGYIARLQKWGV